MGNCMTDINCRSDHWWTHCISILMFWISWFTENTQSLLQRPEVLWRNYHSLLCTLCATHKHTVWAEHVVLIRKWT